MWGHIPIARNKYIYIRHANLIANDDDPASSVCIPVSAVRGLIFLAGNSIVLRYESPFQFAMGDNDDNDGCLIGITTNEHRAFAESLVSEITFGDASLIVLWDGVTGEKFNDDITSVGIVSDTAAD